MFGQEIAQLAPRQPQPLALSLSPTNSSPTPTLGLSSSVGLGAKNSVAAVPAKETSTSTSTLTSIAQPVTVRGRGARLSFLHGRTKDSPVSSSSQGGDPFNGPVSTARGALNNSNSNSNSTATVAGSTVSLANSNRTTAGVHPTDCNEPDRRSILSKEQVRRRSLFHGRVSVEQSMRPSLDWATESTSTETAPTVPRRPLAETQPNGTNTNTSTAASIVKRASVRKRLSLLKLAGKRNRADTADTKVGDAAYRPGVGMASLDEE